MFDAIFKWISPSSFLEKEALIKRFSNAIKVENGHVYLSVENLLPPRLYRRCLKHWPALHLADGVTRTRVLTTSGAFPADMRPADVQFWTWFNQDIVEGKIKPALRAAFLPYLHHKLDFLTPDEIEAIKDSVTLIQDGNEGLCVDRGFVLGPHVDQYYNLFSFLFYLPPDDTQAEHGTRLFQPIQGERRSIDTSFGAWGEFAEFVRFPFLPNTAVAFLQTPYAWHGVVADSAPGIRRSYLSSGVISPAVLERLYGLPPVKERAPLRLAAE